MAAEVFYHNLCIVVTEYSEMAVPNFPKIQFTPNSSIYNKLDITMQIEKLGGQVFGYSHMQYANECTHLVSRDDSKPTERILCALAAGKDLIQLFKFHIHCICYKVEFTFQMYFIKFSFSL